MAGVELQRINQTVEFLGGCGVLDGVGGFDNRPKSGEMHNAMLHVTEITMCVFYTTNQQRHPNTCSQLISR
jgi:hypothetical protein